MDRPPVTSRNYLRIALGVFIALLLAIIIIGTISYWGGARNP